MFNLNKEREVYVEMDFSIRLTEYICKNMVPQECWCTDVAVGINRTMERVMYINGISKSKSEK